MDTMTHGDILLHELTQRTQITMRELLATYAPRGYTKNGFTAAAVRLRRRGLIAPNTTYRGIYARAACCPCCGRAYDER
jgi:hypothetical protein